MANTNNTRQAPSSKQDDVARTNPSKPDSREFNANEQRDQRDQRSSQNSTSSSANQMGNRQSSPGKHK